MNYELVIFDCDGVLVDSEVIANTTFAAEVRKLGIPFSDEEAKANFPGTTLAKCISYVELKYNTKLPDDIDKRYRAASFQAFKERLEPIAHVESILRDLRINKCVASNGPKNKMVLNLNLVNFADYFGSHLYSAYDINLFKPDPGIFLHAAEQMNVPPEKCIVIEDSIHGFEAGIKAGMKVLAYDPHGNSDKIEEVSYFEDMTSIYATLKKLDLIS